VTVNPGGGSGWDEPPLDIQVPDDARELDRDVLAYHREVRAKRRRNRLRRLSGPFAAHGTVMPLLASILAVCLVAGAMLSVATFSPATVPAEQTPRPPTAAATPRPAASRPAATPATGPVSATAKPSGSGHATRSARPSRSPKRPAPSARPSGSGSP
jgi:hypothetical protein